MRRISLFLFVVLLCVCPSFADKRAEAVVAAQSYLLYMPFSARALENQLVYDGYSKEQAAFGVLNSNADWNRQALWKAENYLETSLYSAQGLYDRLIYDGFTKEQAAYAVGRCNLEDAILSDVEDLQALAIDAAKRYINRSPYSRKGLIAQLVHDGFTGSQAEHGVDACDVDWHVQAVRSASRHLRAQAMSDEELLTLLMYDGFTRQEAEYGVKRCRTPLF